MERIILKVHAMVGRPQRQHRCFEPGAWLCRRGRRCSQGILVLMLCSAIAAASTNTMDLLADASAWSTWSPRPALSPAFTQNQGGTPGGGLLELAVAGTGSPLVCGRWQRALPALEQGRRYRIEAAFQAKAVEMPARNVRAVIIDSRGGRQRWYTELELSKPLDERKGPAGSVRGCLTAVIAPEQDRNDLLLGLYLAWSPGGQVSWSDITLTDISAVPARTRMAQLAAVSGSPGKAGWKGDPIDFYCGRLDEIGSQGADLVCLPEVINNNPERIPGKSTRKLAEMARKHTMYVAASLREKDGEAHYNTGILIDRAGEIIGKYRKTHLAPGEGLLSGYTPGDSYPVFRTDIGTVGYIICYDYHFPETARILATRGAEMILLSNMGDGREGGTLWEPCIRTRALDNNVHIVASVNGGRSCIVDPRGEILSMVDGTPGAIASARCDLNVSLSNFTRRPIGNRYQRMRRSDTYTPLTRHLWDTMKENRAPGNRGAKAVVPE